jgi:hypothetical protein
MICGKTDPAQLGFLLKNYLNDYDKLQFYDGNDAKPLAGVCFVVSKNTKEQTPPSGVFLL